MSSAHREGMGAQLTSGARTLAAPLASGALLAGGQLSAQLAPAQTQALAASLLGAAIVVGVATFAPQAIRRSLSGRLGVDTLMTLAAVGAVALGELAEAAVLAFLFSLAEGLESLAAARAHRDLRALLALAPKHALVRRAGRELEIDASELRVGDRLLLRPGERAAADGIVRAGRSALDVSLVTGESLPVECAPGDFVAAGALNSNGLLEIEITRAGSDHTLARLVRTVGEALANRGHGERLAERIARPLVPAVLALAGATFLVRTVSGEPLRDALERTLAVLVAAAPCAFAVGVPVVAVAAVGAAARRGVVVKGGATLERLAAIRDCRTARPARGP